jgi:UrcA family protein
MKSIKILLTVAALSVSGLAAAAPRGEANSVVVRYGDLNLNSQAGIAVLHKRISNAARTVCSSLDTRILGLRDAYDSCVADATANGVAAVGNPNLTQFHDSKGKSVVVASN